MNKLSFGVWPCVSGQTGESKLRFDWYRLCGRTQNWNNFPSNWVLFSDVTEITLLQFHP